MLYPRNGCRDKEIFDLRTREECSRLYGSNCLGDVQVPLDIRCTAVNSGLVLVHEDAVLDCECRTVIRIYVLHGEPHSHSHFTYARERRREVYGSKGCTVIKTVIAEGCYRIRDGNVCHPLALSESILFQLCESFRYLDALQRGTSAERRRSERFQPFREFYRRQTGTAEKCVLADSLYAVRNVQLCYQGLVHEGFVAYGSDRNTVC